MECRCQAFLLTFFPGELTRLIQTYLQCEEMVRLHNVCYVVHPKGMIYTFKHKWAQCFQDCARGEPATALELENGTVTLYNYVPTEPFEYAKMSATTSDELLVVLQTLRAMSAERTWTRACEVLQSRIRHFRHVVHT